MPTLGDLATVSIGNCMVILRDASRAECMDAFTVMENLNQECVTHYIMQDNGSPAVCSCIRQLAKAINSGLIISQLNAK